MAEAEEKIKKIRTTRRSGDFLWRKLALFFFFLFRERERKLVVLLSIVLHLSKWLAPVPHEEREISALPQPKEIAWCRKKPLFRIIKNMGPAFGILEKEDVMWVRFAYLRLHSRYYYSQGAKYIFIPLPCM